jgi:hypothetical protein
MIKEDFKEIKGANRMICSTNLYQMYPYIWGILKNRENKENKKALDFRQRLLCGKSNYYCFTS